MSAESLRPWRPGPTGWDAAAALHLFRRAAFGATPGELERALDEGPQATLARLFEQHGAPELSGSIDSLLAADDLELLQAWWMALLLEGGAPLRERMTLFWHGHFATSHDKVGDVRMMHAQNELFRTHGLGDFRRLLAAVIRDPAMLVWLDGDSNRRGHPNENLARELLELFALGIGNYGEEDVRELARCLTGLGTDGRAFAWRPEHHDGGAKTLLGRTAPFEVDEALTQVLTHPACAAHVARRLLEAFVVPDPDAPTVVAVAELLLGCDWDLAATLHVLLASELFYSPRARRARIAAPVELVVVSARALDARIAPRRAARAAAAMGQALFRPPSVKGWEGGRGWIHTGHWIARHNFLVELVAADRAERGEIRLDLAGSSDAANVDALLTRLLPEGAEGELAASLERVRASAGSARAGVRAQAALVLTAPEHQLF